MYHQSLIDGFFKSIGPRTSTAKSAKTVKKSKGRKSTDNNSTNQSLNGTSMENFNHSLTPDSSMMIKSQKRLNNSQTSPGSPSKKNKTLTSPSSPSKKKMQKSPASQAVRRLRSNRGSFGTVQTEHIDGGKVSNMIDNLNLARVGIIPRNNFCLGEIYAQDSLPIIPDLNKNKDVIQIVYDGDGVVIPKENAAQDLFNLVTEVFSDPMNCGYFDDEELDQIFSYLTLSEKAQSLLVRMIKRKHQWQRSSSINYPIIDDDLKPHFDELVALGFYTSDVTNQSLETLFDMLNAEEVREICLKSRIPWKNRKADGIKKLIEVSKVKPLFASVQSPRERLRETVIKSLDHCVCIKNETVSLFDRIINLFTPWEEISSTFSDMFLKIMEVRNGSMIYPETPVKNYPRFCNRDHLFNYVEWKNKWRLVDGMIKTNPENWETLKSIGREAYNRFTQLLESNSDGMSECIPRHIRNYSEEYVCAKLITICLDVFKRDESLVPEAVTMLNKLLEQQSYLQSKKGIWYEEIALIETRLRKNLEAAAAATIAGLKLENLIETARIGLIKRAKGLIRRKSGLEAETRARLVEVIEEQPKAEPPKIVEIDANSVNWNRAGKKSTWFLDMGDEGKMFSTVEGRAWTFYRENGWTRYWHCEGSLPVTLFTLLMWDEIYTVPVKAAFLSRYQKAPLDLYGSEFYDNRKEFIEAKLAVIEGMTADEISDEFEKSFDKRINFSSIMLSSLPYGIDELKDMVKCMGTNLVTGICRRMASNFVGWRAGFPDLLLWNPKTLKCKIVEVKGPRDSLSAKQTLWLEYLDNLGAATEVCEVKNVTKTQRREND